MCIDSSSRINANMQINKKIKNIKYLMHQASPF